MSSGLDTTVNFKRGKMCLPRVGLLIQVRPSPLLYHTLVTSHTTGGEGRLSVRELSEFYKRFLDDKYPEHLSYTK